MFCSVVVDRLNQLWSVSWLAVEQKAAYVKKQDEAQAKNPALEKNVRIHVTLVPCDPRLPSS